MLRFFKGEKPGPTIKESDPSELERLVLGLTFPQSLLALDQLSELANGDSSEAKAAINRIDNNPQLRTQILALSKRKPARKNYNPMDRENW